MLRTLEAIAFALAVAATTLAWPKTAHADPPSEDAKAPTSPGHAAIGINFGLASAVGFAGLTLTGALGAHARVEAGVGFGYSGLQLSLMPKLVLGGMHDHFVAGAGVAIAFPDDPRLAAGNPIWLNVDVGGYEHRFSSGLALSIAIGFTGGLGGGKICVPPDGCESQFQRSVTRYWLPQSRVGVAYWF